MCQSTPHECHPDVAAAVVKQLVGPQVFDALDGSECSALFEAPSPNALISSQPEEALAVDADVVGTDALGETQLGVSEHVGSSRSRVDDLDAHLVDAGVESALEVGEADGVMVVIAGRQPYVGRDASGDEVDVVDAPVLGAEP